MTVPSIMIVDDDPEVSELLAELLQARGYHVVTCQNGMEALLQLRSKPPPCVILLDLHMPVMDGYAFRHDQTQDASIAGIPVLVISDLVSIDRARLAGTELVPKPFKIDRLIDAIERHRHASLANQLASVGLAARSR